MHILHTVKKRGWSGETNSLLMLAAGQAARGHRVSVAAAPTSATAQRARDRALALLAVVFDRPFHRLPVIRDGQRLLEFLRREHVDIVHCHASFDHWVMARLARRAGALLVRTKRNRKDIKRHPLNRWLYTQRTDATVAISAAVRDDLRTTGFFAGAIPIIENGIDLERFHGIDRRAVRATLGLDGPVVLYAGRITERKRVANLLAAAALVARQVPRLITIVAGSGDAALSAALRSQWQSERVRFLDHRDDIPQLLTAADVLCYPARDEAFGLVPLEAMACGC
ncbi:MAG: glycosyltransferase family 4 protein, partial [Planctomycetota bacterium]